MLAAVKSGDAKELAELIRQDPGYDVNMGQNATGWTLLHYACYEDAVIPVLLAHPAIDVNVKPESGFTPFMLAGSNGCTSCVRELLKDPRVKVNETINGGRTPLWYATTNDRLEVIKWWIASGREMDLGTPGDVYKTDAISMAKKWGRHEVVTLLQRFKENPEETTHKIRVELGWYAEAAAEIFALMVFVSDELLQVNDATTPSPAARFFSIARKLPLELKMILCLRVVGSVKELIPTMEREAAFKELANRLLWSSMFTS